jgi:hypothetical protein
VVYFEQMNLLIRTLVFQLVFMGLASSSFAATKSGSQVINQVLFYESAQSWTMRDFQLFEKMKPLVLQKPLLSQFVESANEDFLLSRLSAREAQLFEIAITPLKLSDSQRKSLSTFTNSEINQELAQISSATALIDLKEVQLKQKLRFKTWFDLLKRKYQVKVKTADFP